MKKYDDNRNSEVVQVVAQERKRGTDYRKKYKEALLTASEGDVWNLQADAPINVLYTPESVPVPNLPIAVPVVPPPVVVNSQMIPEFTAEQREANSDEEFVARRRLRRGIVMSESSVHEDDLDHEDDDVEEDEPEISESEDSDEGRGIRTRRRALFAQLRNRNHQLRRRSQRLRTRQNQQNNNTGRLRATGMNLRSRGNQDDPRLGKRDPTTMSQNSDEDSTDFYRNFGKNRHNKETDVRREQLPVVQEEHFCTRCQKVGAREQCEGAGEDESHGCHRIYHRECSDLCGADVKNNTSFYCFYCLLKYYAANQRETYEYNKENDLENSWLEIMEEDTDLLTPQIGDTFYFIWQPYESFVSKFFDILNFKLGKTFWPWDSQTELQSQDTKVLVTNITYEYPEVRGKKKFYEYQTYLTTLMCITLEICTPEDTMDEGSKTFEIKYFPASDAPSFLIWHKIYERKKKEYQIARNFGDVKYNNEHYSIRDKCAFEDAFEGSLYRALKIRAVAPGISTRHREQSAPDGELAVSPWDVEFSQNTQIVANTKPTLRKSDEPAEPYELGLTSCLNEITKSHFEEFMQGPAKFAGPFLFQVETAQYPDYVNCIRVHMYLMKIYMRVSRNYYRSLESLMHDVQILRENAEAYNSPNSKIVEMAKVLMELIEAYLETDNRNPARIKHLTKQLAGMNMANNGFSIGNPSQTTYNLRRKQKETTEPAPRPVQGRQYSVEESEGENSQYVSKRPRPDRRQELLASPAPMKAGVSLEDRKTRHERRLMKTSGTPEENRTSGSKENPSVQVNSRVRSRQRLVLQQDSSRVSGMALRRRSQH